MEHSQVVLGAILPDRKDRLLFATERLEDEHFRVESDRALFKLLGRYWDVTGAILSGEALSDMLERQHIEPSKVLLYETLYSDLAEKQVTDADFKYSVDALRDVRSGQLTGEAIVQGMEILERGLEVGKERLEGHREARAFLYDRLSTIDGLGDAKQAPEGDMRNETDDMLRDYADRHSGKTPAGMYVGIPEIDLSTSGIQPGELVLVCAYTGAGKSNFATQTAWRIAVEQGKNAFIATSETIRRQVMRRIAARHSRLPQFDCPDGINVRDIKDGTLSPQHEDVYRNVLTDLRTNPAYGKLYVAQIPRGAGLKFVEQRMNRQAQQWHIDCCVIDYLALLKANTRRQSEREEFNEIIKDAKTLATSFNDGDGVGLISPWAMSQTAYKNARDKGSYTMANLAETSEAEKSPDLIWSILWDRETYKEATMQMLKNRDGESSLPFQVEVDYRNAFIGPKRDSAAEALLAGDESDPFG